jgi:hypothetical protein
MRVRTSPAVPFTGRVHYLVTRDQGLRDTVLNSQRLIQVRIKRLANDTRIVTRFTVQQSFRNEHVDFRFA